MSILDYIILVSYFMLMLMIGGWYRQRNRSMDDFLLGGRRMKSLPVAASLFVSWFSVISYTAIPGEMAANGPMIWSGLLVAPIGLWFVGWVVIPKIRETRQREYRWESYYDARARMTWRLEPISSAYAIVSNFFGEFTARLASTLFLLMRVSWMAMIVHIASRVIMTPILSLGRSGPVYVALVLIGVTVIYSLGGFRAVVLTDCIQAGIMFGGAIAIICVVHSPGVAVWPTEWPASWPVPSARMNVWERADVLCAMTGALTLGICVKTGDQMNVQRYLSVPNVRTGRSVLILGFLFDLCLTALLGFVGLCLLAHFQAVPDADSFLPRLIGSGLPFGMTGLVVAALLAAAMSSLSSGINACVSTVATDWRIGRSVMVATVGLGIIVFILSQIIGMVEGNLFELCYKIVNLLATPLGGLVLTALFIPRVKVAAVWIGCFACIGVVVYITYFSPITFLLASPLGLAAQLSIAWTGRER